MKEESDPISSSVATGTEVLRTELLACNPRVRIAQNTSEERKKGNGIGLKAHGFAFSCLRQRCHLKRMSVSLGEVVFDTQGA